MNPTKIFKRFLQKPQYRVDCRDISPSIALAILEKEIDLEKSVSLQLIHDLTLLYSKTIEHYESRDNPKYLDFQEKLQKMLLKPQVYSILSTGSNSHLSDSSIKTIQNPNQSSLNPKRFSFESKSKNSSPEPSAPQSSCRQDSARKSYSSHFSQAILSCPNNLINSHSSSSKLQSNNAISVLKSQDLGLEQKKSARRLKKENRQVSFSNLPDLVLTVETGFDAPKTPKNMRKFPQSAKNSARKSWSTMASPQNRSFDFRNIDEYERKLEVIMESNHDEKAWKVVQVKAKYDKEAEMGKDATLLRTSMESEIKGIAEIYDMRINQEILKAKEEMLR